jgi:hypothetical protein
MNRTKYIIAACALGLCLCAATQAKEIKKEIQFTTLPQVVRTTVFHRYNIVSPEKVVRVVEEPDNIYEITVLTDSGDQVVYVTADGNIVQRPSTVVEEGGQGSAEVTVTMDEIRGAGERYEFVQDQGPDAIYIDHQTNKRVIVKGGAGQGSRGGARSTEENKTNIRTNETDRTKVQTDQENKGSVRTEDKDQQSGAMREKTDEGNADEGNKNVRQDQRTQHDVSRGEQKDQGNQERVGNGQEQKTRDTSANSRTDEKSTDQRNMKENQGEKQQHQNSRTPGEQQSQDKSKSKAKPSPGS